MPPELTFDIRIEFLKFDSKSIEQINPTGGTTYPLWFDTLASGSLIIGILLGAFLFERIKPNFDNRVLTTSTN